MIASSSDYGQHLTVLSIVLYTQRVHLQSACELWHNVELAPIKSLSFQSGFNNNEPIQKHNSFY